MADAPTPQKKDVAPPARPPAGPGLLMVAGIAMLFVAFICGYDYFVPREDWEKQEQGWKASFNGICMLVAVCVSIYCFVQAFLRGRQSKTAAAAKKPDEAGTP